MPVLAYLDPGSGSLVLQAVLGGAAGIGVAARAMKQRWERRRVTGDKAPDERNTVASSASSEQDEVLSPETSA